MIFDITGKELIGSIDFDVGVLENLPAEDIAVIPDLVGDEDGNWSITKWRLVQRTQVETRSIEDLMAAYPHAKDKE